MMEKDGGTSELAAVAVVYLAVTAVPASGLSE